MARPRGSVYELTVSGRLGPVLRHALRPFARASSSRQTVLRVETSEEAEVPEVVQLLESRGLEVVEVTLLQPEDSTP